ncbi:ABC transporter substrate-binding protein [Leptolyngbya sp. AN02str]|uniref:ABC transporter substrate-binding protein n=1 Tax=Leptolyngbya sp. AN02str TaxID=3423363 RepID=UPI003D31A227
MTNLSSFASLVVSLGCVAIALNACVQPSSDSSSALSQTDSAMVQSPTVQSPVSSPVESREAVTRVVALSSLSADILHRLDSSVLVGISGSSLFANDARFAELPTVSSGRTPPNLEAIVALEPDLVVGVSGFHDQALQALEDMGIDTLTTNVNSWDGLIELTETLARAIAADPSSLLEYYASLLPPASHQQGSTLVLVSQQPILSPNQTSWAGDLLQRFNANNLASELQGSGPFSGYVTLSPEKVLEANPDRLILVDPEDSNLEQLKAQPFWNQLKAVQNDQVHTLNYYGLVNPGSIEAIEQACRQLQQLLDIPSS